MMLNDLAEGDYNFEIYTYDSKGSEDGAATNIIDNNPTNFWHSRWSSSATDYPHQVIIDLGAQTKANGLSITRRSGLGRTVKDLELWTSNSGSTYTQLSTLIIANVNGAQYFNFANEQSFRYLKVIAKSAWDGKQFAALAEVGLY